MIYLSFPTTTVIPTDVAAAVVCVGTVLCVHRCGKSSEYGSEGS